MIPLYHFFLLISLLPLFSCQFNSPQNIETFYPRVPPPNIPIPITPNNPPGIIVRPPPLLLPLPPPPPHSKLSTAKTLTKAVAATAATTLVIAAFFFFLIQRNMQRRKKNSGDGARGGQVVVSHNEFSRVNGNLKGLVVDENGLDVLYWRKLEGMNYTNNFDKRVLHHTWKDEEKEQRGRSKRSEPIQEISLLQGKYSGSEREIQESRESEPRQEMFLFRGKSSTSSDQFHVQVKEANQIQPPPLPPPLSVVPRKSSPAPPPQPPPVPAKTSFAAPPPPPVPVKTSPALPPPPSAVGGSAPSSKPPQVPKGMGSSRKSGESSAGGHVPLKPLHWEKVNANAEHSMVWDKMDRGSFKFDDDLMEALFGSVATNRKSPRKEKNPTKTNTPPAQIRILDARKSQNVAIVIRTLSISRREILDALNDGQGLDLDTLEKLTRISPTKEEESQILAFDGDPTKLADAESFLYHLLKAVPSAFSRLNAMLFRLNYASEVQNHKENQQTLELACKELKTRGLFVKLLEAILKAGNRMNAGTARGNAQAFNLTSLLKLSDVKSTDGKTTLLHFVVEEVVRSEGRRCAINQNHSLSRNNSTNSHSSAQKEEKEKGYITLGLVVVGGLSSEFTNVKKSSTIDYDAFVGACSALTTRTEEIRKLVAASTLLGGGEGFVKEMRSFLEEAEEEIKLMREEQKKVMELVKKTTQYYQAGTSKGSEAARPIQLFIIVRDFLGMVDQACENITRNAQKKRLAVTSF